MVKKEEQSKAGEKVKEAIKKASKDDIDTKDLKIKELTDIAQHVQADFENYRKRTEKEKEEFVKFACSKLIEQILPLIDNFELALKHTGNKDEFIKGVELIYSEFVQLLQNNGVEPIHPEVGEDFNAYEHEALLTEKSKQKENTIVELMQKGYRIGDKIIRHAKVKVAKN